jgi:hypothetical protein
MSSASWRHARTPRPPDREGGAHEVSHRRGSLFLGYLSSLLASSVPTLHKNFPLCLLSPLTFQQVERVPFCAETSHKEEQPWNDR